jgi:hypothetical protein
MHRTLLSVVLLLATAAVIFDILFLWSKHAASYRQRQSIPRLAFEYGVRFRGGIPHGKATLAPPQPLSTGRRMPLQRAGSNVTDRCQNSVHGRNLIVDSRGNVCPADAVNVLTKCCPENGNSPLSCLSCNQTASDGLTCCKVYEYCVSCCLQPQRTAYVRQLLLRKKASGVALFFDVNAEDSFSICLASCRTNAASTSHENRFNQNHIHCF